MNIKKNNPIYLLLVFTIASMLVFSSCGGDDAEQEPKPDFASLILGEYEGKLSVGEEIDSKASLRKGNAADEIIFTEVIERENQPDSTVSFKIELIDINSYQAVALRIPQQIIGNGVKIVGSAIDEDDPRGYQGYFFYQDENKNILNGLAFVITGNNGYYYYDYTKVEE
ncbi:hypothetical protein [Bernardetia sp.]|uniref:hypothetical protein n=1 Tax=Bernardetia sp. TaxID=1937974 RepID=UPI0025B85A7E|nr:hypothetical protein [Bernardetia sp.]